MCASFTPSLNKQNLLHLFEDLKVSSELEAQWPANDVYPFQKAAIVVKDQSGYRLVPMRYSLTPAWSKDEKVKWATYNARMNRFNEKIKRREFIYEVPTWKTAFAKHHALVPLQSFRESCREGKAKGFLVDFKPTNTELLWAAGIYEEWINTQTGEVVPTFAIITTDPNDYIKDVGHDRSPVLLDEHSAKRWLERFDSPKSAYEFLVENHSIPPLRYENFRPLKT